MQLISKWYALFYLNTKNKHTSIPSGVSYQAIDNPNSFQKYVWAGLEKTLKKYYKELETTENQIVTYKGYLPILPYFSCSAGFTRSGKEKWWWTDTPYLVSRIDLNSCEKFDGHGVGLSGKW
jgi:peptidoglycan hydrolase-like amidase